LDPTAKRAIVEHQLVKFLSLSQSCRNGLFRFERVRTGQTTAASAPPYTGFQIPAMAFFAHPLFVRLSHIESLGHKPRRTGQKPLKSLPFRR
jgi:hypothetical protein